MNRTYYWGMVSLVWLVAASPVVAQVSTVEARLATLGKIDRFEARAPADLREPFAGAPNPFFPDVPEAEPAEDEIGPAVADRLPAVPPPPDDRLVLREVAAQIRPSGVMQFRDRTMLLFGERRISSGDMLSVAYRGTQYQIQIISVENNAFTMRLNEEVITKRIQ
jgi:hypothetical protein